MWKRHMLLLISLAPFLVSGTSNAETPPAQDGPLTLERTLALVAEYSSVLRASALEVAAVDTRVRQARLFPNPELSATVENFGNSVLQGIDGRSTTIQLGQRIEMGGKRGRRVSEASLGSDAAAWEHESVHRGILFETKQAFIEALSAQERLKAADEQVELSRHVYEAVAARVGGGKVSPVEEVKAGVALSSSILQRDRRGMDLENARKRLAALWGSASPSFARVEGNLEEVPAPPSAEGWMQDLAGNPALRKWDAEVARREAALAGEKAVRVPDPNLGAGVRIFNETGDRAWIVSLSFPIPLADRNQGAVAEARLRAEQAREERKAAEVELATQLAEAHAACTVSYGQIQALRKDVLPGAQRAFEAVEEGYRLGKFGYLDVLDAQRTWTEAKLQWVDALAAYHTALAALERLAGPLSEKPSFVGGEHGKS